ncbi:hypothetical protein [Cobetia amphilecti]|uniref:hypothetical protein n=1 Tax=Cobetia amphilecti TaxID=1055104 RepID=UPI0026E33439|nr:hypothetical protein [Cobetia amphilecti]MDO6816820.1 hypothetical protein [Cobetia amphilecti]
MTLLSSALSLFSQAPMRRGACTATRVYRPSAWQRLCRAGLGALLLLAGSAQASSDEAAVSPDAPLAPVASIAPVPFTAHYTLVLNGWPDVPITQRVSQSGELYIASMEASIKVASGYEQGRFTLAEGRLLPEGYRSGYRLAGIGKDYNREAPEAGDTRLPDRQSLLVLLSQQVDSQWSEQACLAATPCSLDYLDHKGRQRTLMYEIQGQETRQAAQRTFRTLRIEAWRKHREHKHYRIWLAPRWPGLMVGLDYLDYEDVMDKDGNRNGEVPPRSAHLTLNQLSSARQ